MGCFALFDLLSSCFWTMTSFFIDCQSFSPFFGARSSFDRILMFFWSFFASLNIARVTNCESRVFIYHQSSAMLTNSLYCKLYGFVQSNRTVLRVVLYSLASLYLMVFGSILTAYRIHSL